MPLKPTKQTHFASITDPVKVGEMLKAFDGFTDAFPVKCALNLVTKTNTDHLVPLATQAVAILRELHCLTERGKYLFPSLRSASAPMSSATINAPLRRLGDDTRTEITGHGFRAMARTLLSERLHQKTEVIEHQLAHAVPDALGGAYNRTKLLFHLSYNFIFYTLLFFIIGIFKVLQPVSITSLTITIKLTR